MNGLTSSIKMPVLKFLMIFLGITMGIRPLYGQQFRFKDHRMVQRIAFSMLKNLIVIPVYIDGKGPFRFILDTGVGPMIITDPSLIDSLQLKNLRSIKIAGLGKGEPVEAFVSNQLTAIVGNAQYPQIPTAILKEDLFNLSSYLGTHIHGLIGYHFFKSFIVEIRYTSRRIIFYDPLYRRKIKGTRIPLNIIGDKPYAKVSIRFDGRPALPISVLIDNGASHAISLEKLGDEPFPAPEKTIAANLGVGLSGVIDGRMGRAASLQIGNYTLNNVLSSFPDFHDVVNKILIRDRSGNLGADVLSRFNTTYDYGGSAVYLKKNHTFRRPFQHDMAGMEITAEGPDLNRFIIGRIEPDSPADEAMLLKDDEIVSIDFSSISRYSLTELNEIFRNGRRKLLLVTVIRSGQRLTMLLKLKQRI